MSAWCESIFKLHKWPTSSLAMLDCLLAGEWRLLEAGISYRPMLEDNDDAEWQFAPPDQWPRIRSLFDEQERRGLNSGITLRLSNEPGGAGFVFKPAKLELEVQWDPLCPKNKDWPRLVDPTWALSRLATISDQLKLDVFEIRLSFLHPWPTASSGKCSKYQ